MKKNVKRLLWTGGTCIALIPLVLCIAFSLQKAKLRKQIKKGKIQYISKIGWIDWAHAIPTGPKKLVTEISEEPGDTISYYQDMKKKIAGTCMVVRLTNKYYVPKSKRKTSKQRAGIARYILEDVSTDFEKLQASYPYDPLCGIGVGDRNGDRIALLRALHIRFNGKLGHSDKKNAAIKRFNKNPNDASKPTRALEKLLPKPILVKKLCSITEHLALPQEDTSRRN